MPKMGNRGDPTSEAPTPYSTPYSSSTPAFYPTVPRSGWHWNRIQSQRKIRNSKKRGETSRMNSSRLCRTCTKIVDEERLDYQSPNRLEIICYVFNHELQVDLYINRI